METGDFDYDAFVRPMEPRLMRTVWRIMRNREAAEDALQDTLTAVWKKRGTVARHPNPTALVLRIAVATAIDALRRRNRRLRHETSGVQVDRAEDPASPVTKTLEDGDLRAAVVKAIGDLPRRQAAAVILHIVEEQSYEDIARAMGCSAATVRVHVLRGRSNLARLLAKGHPDMAAGFGWRGKEAAESRGTGAGP